MEPRMNHPAFVVPDAMQTLQALGKIVHTAGKTLPIELVNLRASQINGCSVCVDMHSKALKQAGETDERLFSVAAWREAPWFDDDERAALALTEAMTRQADKSDPVTDEVWDEAAKHYSEEDLAVLTLAIANINLWNRLNAATRQMPGAWAA